MSARSASTAASEKLPPPMPLRDTSIKEGEERNYWSNLIQVITAFVFLYAFYAAFFAWWLFALNQWGNKLLWFFFGLFLSTFGGMAGFTAYSMSQQKVGWFHEAAPVEGNDSNVVCCDYKWF